MQETHHDDAPAQEETAQEPLVLQEKSPLSEIAAKAQLVAPEGYRLAYHRGALGGHFVRETPKAAKGKKAVKALRKARAQERRRLAHAAR